MAVVRAESKEQGEKIIDAIIEGGIHFIEITMTVPGALDIIKTMCDKYKDDEKVVIGAGTVLDSETARAVILAGACAVGTGSSLTKGAKTNDFAAITAKAREFVAQIV